MAQVVNKKVRLTLVGLDGNCFVLMGAFQEQALREKWATAEIDAVMNEAMSGNYEHLLATLAAHCENPCGGSDDDGDYEE